MNEPATSPRRWAWANLLWHIAVVSGVVAALAVTDACTRPGATLLDPVPLPPPTTTPTIPTTPITTAPSPPPLRLPPQHAAIRSIDEASRLEDVDPLVALQTNRTALSRQLMMKRLRAQGPSAREALLATLDRDDPWLTLICLELLVELAEEHHQTLDAQEREELLKRVEGNPHYARRFASLVERMAPRTEPIPPPQPPSVDVDVLLASRDTSALGRGYVQLLADGHGKEAAPLLAALDDLLGPLPPPTPPRILHTFEGRVGWVAFGEDVWLGFHGDERGSLHVVLLRHGHVVEITSLPPGDDRHIAIHGAPRIMLPWVWFGTHGELDAGGLNGFDLRSGQVEWHTPIGNVRYANPTVYRNRVYVTSQGTSHITASGQFVPHGDAGVYSIDGRTGAILTMIPAEGVGEGDSSVRFLGETIEFRVRERAHTDFEVFLMSVRQDRFSIIDRIWLATLTSQDTVVHHPSYYVSPPETSPSQRCRGVHADRDCHSAELVCYEEPEFATPILRLPADVWECANDEWQPIHWLGEVISVGRTLIAPGPLARR